MRAIFILKSKGFVMLVDDERIYFLSSLFLECNNIFLLQFTLQKNARIIKTQIVVSVNNAFNIENM